MFIMPGYIPQHVYSNINHLPFPFFITHNHFT